MKETQTLIIEGDTVTALYNESVGVDVREIGEIVRCEKISDVIFNVDLQVWEAIDRATGEVIASDESRSGCVRKEHAFYEGQIANGRLPWSDKRGSGRSILP